MLELKTTTDCVNRANEVLKQAKQIETKEDHIQMWNRKAEIFKLVNDSLASGAFRGEALDELRESKNILYRAETIAGEQAEKTYAKKLKTKRED